MPAPLLWLGAACVGLYASNKANHAYLKHTKTVRYFPGESSKRIVPVNGSIVTCNIYGVLDHTGIWIDGGIYELSGSGLIRKVSPARFLENRSGEDIFIACDDDFLPLVSPEVSERCKQSLYEFRDYHLLNNNCHRFVLEMLFGEKTGITSFSDLNDALSTSFLTSINWHKANVEF